MADLHGALSSPLPEPDDLSSFLHQFLRSSSFSCHSHSLPFLTSPLPYDSIPCRPTPPPTESSSAWNSAASCNVFSTSDGCFPPAATVLSSSSVGNTDNDPDSEDGYEAMMEELQPKLASIRKYSKRSRAAEIHNLSEKRRRSRINEKMKALQKLIPNSNKTDKASMLDEAIEYLKQLQLQVQMLTMRNGHSLYPPDLGEGRGTRLKCNNEPADQREHGSNSQTSLEMQTMIENHLGPYQQRNMMIHAADWRSCADFQMGSNLFDGLEPTAPWSESSPFFDDNFEWPEHRKTPYLG